MKVLLVNGSPHKNGCTYTALSIVADALNKEGIDTEIMYLGNKPIAGCIGCGKCAETGECFRGDIVNDFIKNGRMRWFHIRNSSSFRICYRSYNLIYGPCVYDSFTIKKQTGCSCCKLP